MSLYQHGLQSITRLNIINLNNFNREREWVNEWVRDSKCMGRKWVKWTYNILIVVCWDIEHNVNWVHVYNNNNMLCV